MTPIPDSALALIEDLESNYPPHCKEPGESLEQHMQLSGQVELVALLRRRYEWTQQNSKMSDILKGK